MTRVSGVLPVALWVVPVPDLGGVARHVLDAAEAGIPGFRVVVQCPPGPLADRLRDGGIAVTTGNLGPAYGTTRSVATVRGTIKALRPAVVHSHLSYADVVVALAAPRGQKLVSTEHGIAADDLVYHGSKGRSAVKAAMHTVRLRRFDALIACSEATREAMIDKWHPPRTVRVIHNGADRRPRQERSAGLRIAALSRLAPEKRIDALIDAFAVVRREHPEATLTIAGEGPRRAELHEHAQATGVPVELTGFADPVEIMNRSDVIAQLSVWENCSYTLLDAVTHGLGVVASRVGGNSEILPGQCLVGDVAPEKVAGALVAQGLQPQQRPSLPAGWPTVGDMTARIAEVYREVLA